MSCLFENPFEITAPAEQRLPFVLNSAHSGRVFPTRFLAQSRLNQHELRRSEDCFVDILFSNAPSLYIPILQAHFPRAYLDANREPYELDPKMFEGRLPSYANIRSMRVAGGLGTIPRIVSEGQEIYASRLSVSEAMERIDQLYRPYHRALRGLLTRTQQSFGEAYLFDCHSMPSASLESASLGSTSLGSTSLGSTSLGSANVRDEQQTRPDIVLGDRFGTSCMPLFIDITQKVFENLGYTVARNRPYAGGFITEHYGNPSAGVHALQIEINRSLYMDEESLEPHSGFSALKDDLTTAIGEIWRQLRHQNGHFNLAAE